MRVPRSPPSRSGSRQATPRSSSSGATASSSSRPASWATESEANSPSACPRTRPRRSPSCRSVDRAEPVRARRPAGGLAGAALRRLAFRGPVARLVAGGRGCLAGSQVDVQDGQQGRGDGREQDGARQRHEALGHQASMPAAPASRSTTTIESSCVTTAAARAVSSAPRMTTAAMRHDVAGAELPRTSQGDPPSGALHGHDRVGRRPAHRQVGQRHDQRDADDEGHEDAGPTASDGTRRQERDGRAPWPASPASSRADDDRRRDQHEGDDARSAAQGRPGRPHRAPGSMAGSGSRTAKASATAPTLPSRPATQRGQQRTRGRRRRDARAGPR